MQFALLPFGDMKPGAFLLLSLCLLFSFRSGELRMDRFSYAKAPLGSGFRMDGYWVWCGSVIKVDSLYHLFASRWPKTGPFPEGYRTNSEIVRAVSVNPMGPYRFLDVVIGERDSAFWDSNMAHNPTIHRIGDEFVLFYIGSDFTTRLNGSKSLLRRVGYATASSIEGPWRRSDRPVVETESNNPALLVTQEGVRLLYRDEKLRIYLAGAFSYRGPYTVLNDNLWPECPLEDFYLFRADNKVQMICEDNVGGISGHVRWGVRFVSDNGIEEWHKASLPVVYDHDVLLDNDSVLHLVRRERPQLLIENGRITHLITSAFDGTNSWSQPVELREPVQIDQVDIP